MEYTDFFSKEYMQDRTFFADAFNYMLYDGKQIIKPEQLNPVNMSALAHDYKKQYQISPEREYGDIPDAAVVMEDGHAIYLIHCIENPSQIHCDIVVQSMFYCTMLYDAQTEDITDSDTDSLHLSHYIYAENALPADTEKILPVVAMTLYFGTEPWTGPTDLHSMMSVNAGVLPFVGDYHINLISPGLIPDEDFDKFHTDLGLALKYLKTATDEKRLLELVRDNEAYRSISINTACLLSIVTNTDMQFDDEADEYDLFLALEEVKESIKNMEMEKEIYGVIAD